MSESASHYGLDAGLWPGVSIPLNAAESAWIVRNGNISQEDLVAQLVCEMLIQGALVIEEGPENTYPYFVSKLRRFRLRPSSNVKEKEWERPVSLILELWEERKKIPLHDICLEVENAWGQFGWKNEVRKNLQTKGYVNGLGFLSAEGRKVRKVLKRRIETAEFEWTLWEFGRPDAMVRLLADMGTQILNVEFFEYNVIIRIRAHAPEMQKEYENYLARFDLHYLENSLKYIVEAQRGLLGSRYLKNS